MTSRTGRLLLALGASAALAAALILVACDGGESTPSPAPAQSPTATATGASTPTAAPTLTPTTEPSPTSAPTTTPSPSPQPPSPGCEAVPDLPTAVSDQADLYSISVPVDWAVVTDEGAMGVQLSRIVLESPEFSVFVDEEAEGPFTPIYYETGAVLTIHVMNTPQNPPYHFGGLMSDSSITIGGVTASSHVFREPSTWAGQLLDAHVNHDGNYYLFTLGYNPDTCPAGEDLFQAMLGTFLFK